MSEVIFSSLTDCGAEESAFEGTAWLALSILAERMNKSYSTADRSNGSITVLYFFEEDSLASFLEFMYKGGEILVMSTLGKPGGGSVTPLLANMLLESLGT